jgi:hypothetical protein
MDLIKKYSGETNYNYVSISPNAWCVYSAETFIEAVEKYKKEYLAV